MAENFAASPERARWVESRVVELPRYAAFLYNVLLDRNLCEHLKEDAFGALWYVLEGADLVPAGDAELAAIDATAFALRALGELVSHARDGTLAIYEEVLHRQGIDLRRALAEAPARFGPLYGATSAIYEGRIQQALPMYKNAVRTGQLVKILRIFLSSFRPPAWTDARRSRVESFLASFRPPAAPRSGRIAPAA